MNLKSYIKKIIPEFANDLLRSIKQNLDFRYDRKRYKDYSNRLAVDPSALSFEEMESDIFLLAHAIEKGLSLDKRRIGFGKEKTRALVELLQKYIEKGFPKGGTCFTNAVSVLSEYFSFQKVNGVEGLEYVEVFLKAVQNTENGFGGTIVVTSSDLMQEAKGDFPALSKSRHSIRTFSKEPVKIQTIKKAVELAQRSPSACNRQSSRIHVIADKALIEKILRLQGGVNGFEESIDKLIVVTSCLRVFRGSGERNQAFVDGGIYSMNLLLALHYCGLGTCALNWAKSRKQDLKLRSLLRISNDENVILMIAVGNLNEEFRVAVSLRKPVEDVLKIH